jgi:uncharacterized protein (DUF4415 family)
MPKLKPGTIFPTPEEDKAINAGITADPDTRELTKEWFKSARPAREVLSPDSYKNLTQLRRGRGRPITETPKVFTGIRLDADVLEAFKSTGKGWQTKINAALRHYLDQKS